MKNEGKGNSHPSDVDLSLGTPTREQGTGLRAVGIEELLRKAVPRIGDADLPDRDLWPAMLQRIQQERAPSGSPIRAVPWFDWALAGGLAMLAVFSPALVPVLLYYM